MSEGLQDRVQPDAAQSALEADILSLIEAFNRSGDATMVVPSAYLEVIIERR